MRAPLNKVDPRPRLQVGDKVKLRNGVRRWTVRAVTTGGRFVILTQPFNPQHTVLYTVIDFDRGIRGKDNYYGLGYETDGQVADALHEFQHTESDDEHAGYRDCPGQEFCRGGAEVSHRSGNHVELDIESINGAATDTYGRHPVRVPALDRAVERIPDLSPSPAYPGLVIRAGQMENA